MTILANMSSAQQAEFQAAVIAAGGVDARIGRATRLTIAPSNAPAWFKSRADYVLTGTDDNVVIQAIIDGLPTLPNFERSKVLVTGGKVGYLEFGPGQVFLTSPVTVPGGSTIAMRGAGVSSWRPIDVRPWNVYEGGTLFSVNSPTGQAFIYPQYTGNRTDTGVPNTIPASGVWFEDIEIRVFNPLATQNNACMNFDGMTTGAIRNVNVLCDNTTNATRRISQGVSLQAGARTDRKLLTGMHVFGFRDTGYIIATTHIDARQLVAGDISGGTSPCGFQLDVDQNCQFTNLHPFSSGIGLKLIGTKAMKIDSVMFETLSNPVSVTSGTNPPVTIGLVYLNSDTAWTNGTTNVDLATKCDVETLIHYATPALRSRNRGTATIAAGATTVTVPHSLVAIPRTPPVVSVSVPVAVGVTYDATNITFTLPATQGTATVIGWDARAA